MGKEKESIKQIILEYYHKGHVQSDPNFYENILHDEWKIFYLNKKDRPETADKNLYVMV